MRNLVYKIGALLGIVREMLNKIPVRTNIILHKGQEWERLENKLLTIVGGTVAISAPVLTLAKGVVILNYRHVLIMSWVFLGLSLIFLLLSYAFGERLHWYLLKQIDKLPDSFSEETFENIQNTHWSYKGATTMNYASLGTGVLGIILLLTFVSLNA